MAESPCVLVINQFASNKGDRAVLLSLLRELGSNGVNRVTVSTSDPAAWRAESPYLPVPIRWIGWGATYPGMGRQTRAGRFLARLFLPVWRRTAFPRLARVARTGESPEEVLRLCRNDFRQALEEADLVISTGGHRVTTLLVPGLDSPSMFDLGAAALTGKPLVLWSQSIGPLGSECDSARTLLEQIFLRAKGVYVRDSQSVEVLRTCRYRVANLGTTPESVFSLYDLVGPPTPPSQRARQACVGIYVVRLRTREAKAAYARTMAGICDRLAETRHRICFLPMAMGKSTKERAVINQILASMKTQPEFEICSPDLTTQDQLRVVASSRIMVGHKTHSIIFALTLGTPVLAVAYHPKTMDFMSQFGLERFCVSDNGATTDLLAGLDALLAEDLDAISAQQQRIAKGIGETVKHDLKRILELHAGWRASEGDPNPPASPC